MRRATLMLITLLVAMTPGYAQEEKFTCPDTLPPRLTLFESGRVTPGSANTLRVNPTTSAERIGRMTAGTIFSILDGPVCAEGYVWWRASVDGMRGWTVEAVDDSYALEPYPPITLLDGPDIEYENVSFSFADTLGSATVRTYAEVLPIPNSPPGRAHPEYLDFRFVDYPTTNAIFKPSISVYPLNEWLDMSQYVGDEYTVLDILLDSTPDDLSDVYIPFLPATNAGRVLQAQAKYLEFQNGRGYRFVTAYAQDVLVLSNDTLIYTYQGVTNDGDYWISAIFPVAASILPDTVDYNDPDFDYAAFVENYDSYKVQMVDDLNALEAAIFTPDLDALDAVVQSLLVE